MNTKILWIILALLIVAAGVLLIVRAQSTVASEPLADQRFAYGAYPYICDNETGFIMEPSEDTRLIRITSTEGGTFDTEVLSEVMSEEGGAKYEGGGVQFRGQGETVQLTSKGKTITCVPVRNQESAPFNFGD